MEALKRAFQEIDRRYVGICFPGHIRLSVYLGVWPLDADDKSLVLKFVRILKYLLLFGGLGATAIFIGGIHARWGDIEKLMESIAVLVVIETAMVKTYLITFKMDGVIDLIRILEDAIKKCLHNDTERKIVDRCKSAGNYLTLWYGLFCTAAGFSYGIIPFFREGRRLPADLWCIFQSLFECTSSPAFEVLYFLTWLVCVSLAIVNSMVDSLCMSMLIYTIGQFRILQYRMEHSREYALRKVALKRKRRKRVLTIHGPELYRCTTLDKETVIDIHTTSSNKMNLQKQDVLRQRVVKPKYSVFETKRRNKRYIPNSEKVKAKIDEYKKQELDLEIDKHLVDCIQNQQMLFRFSELLQKNFGQMFFSELLLAGLVICILLFLIATFKSDPGKMVEWGSILIVAVVQLFAFCWFSSELSHQSTLLNDALYYSDWISAPRQYKKLMRTVMSRALHPVQLTAGGFLPFSVMQFQAIMQSAYSYYATLTEFNQKQ